MGNYKIRLSYMMPSSWLYKFKDMRRSTKNQKRKKESSSSNPFPQPKQLFLPNRPSSYFPSKAQSIHLENRRKRPTNSPSKSISSVSKFDQLHNSPSFIKEFDDTLSFHRLPRILTKPARNEAASKIEFDSKHVMLKRAQKGLHRIKVRPNTPKIEIKNMHANANKSRKMVNCEGLLESFVVVKKTSDPERDFRDSMVDTIIENGLWNLKDLEELLACYLILNSNDYHDVILKVFEDIWVGFQRGKYEVELINWDI